MKKQMCAFFLFFLVGLFSVITVFAKEKGNSPRLVDMAGLLDESEQAEVLNNLNEISVRQKLDLVVVTTDSLDGKTAMEYADDFYDYNGYGFGQDKDGVLLLVSMEERDWWISTTGYGITAFTDAGIEYLSEQFLPDLSDGDYRKAFTKFAACCDDFITQALTKQPYDRGNLPKAPFRFVFWLCVSLSIGFVFAIMMTAVMKGKLKSVHSKPAASDYVKQGSMRVTDSRDLYLYSHVTRIQRPKSDSSASGSSTHRSSSGTSHGGGGGKF